MFNISNQYGFLSGAWHLVYYLPTRYHDKTPFSKAILEFKNNNDKAVKLFASAAKEELEKIDVEFDYIVRALGSQELQVSGTKALDKLGRDLAQHFASIYCPEVLQKNRATAAMHTVSTRIGREIEISESYFVAKKDYDFNRKNILIIDDITTTSTTIREIKRALVKVFPNAKFYLFCLAKTNDDENANVEYYNTFK